MNRDLEKKLWERCNAYLSLLHWIPFLRGVSVCNSLAFSAVDTNSDIDLFIVAKQGRLFLVRSLVTLVLHLSGVRRHGSKIKGRFCLSFFVDDENLDLSPITLSGDYYLALWASEMKPVINDGVFTTFEESNTWLKDYLPRFTALDYSKIIKENHLDDSFKSVLTTLLSGSFGDFCESILSKWQLKRSLKKMSKLGPNSSVVINEGMLKFHNEDRRRHYNRKWFDSFGEKELNIEDFRSILL